MYPSRRGVDGVNQSSFIVGALLAGFILYLAGKGRLGTYASVIWGPAPALPTTGGTGAATTGGPMSLGSGTAGGVDSIIGNIIGFATGGA
jgi:hypothetical protein